MSETKEFKASSKRILELMIHSVYSDREVFLRELICNASDAIDKLRSIALSNPDLNLGTSPEDYRIRIKIDKEKRLLMISDNGIGMSAQELEDNLGVIAESGTGKFEADNPEAALIGQFGVGFYSAFMVADRIRVVSRRYDSEEANMWESTGPEGYTISPGTRPMNGTDIILHIRPDDAKDPDGFSKFLREYPLYKLVKKYTDHIRYPIQMLMPTPVLAEGSTPENPVYDEKFIYQTMNSMVPIWQRAKGEVTREEFNGFYKSTFGDQNDPLSVIGLSVEGTITYKALLYIPSKSPKSRAMEKEDKPGLRLYCNGVLIMENCTALLPEEFEFVKGVVDSPDLNLNLSREMLQSDRMLKKIGENLTKKIRQRLLKLQAEKRDEYETFYREFGLHIKHCALDEGGEKQTQLQDLLLFYSSYQNNLVTLAEYRSRMLEDQKYIYYASGDQIDRIESMPQTELVRAKGMELLYFIDKADEFISARFREYDGKPYLSVIDHDPELSDEEEAESEESSQDFEEAFAFIKSVLGEEVDEIVASKKLLSHPVCLSSGDGMSFEMEKYFAVVKPHDNMKAKRILELNTEHSAFKAMDEARETDPEKAAKIVRILFNQALLIAGLPVPNPAAYTDLLCTLF